MIPRKISTCRDCGAENVPTMTKRCLVGPNYCYNKYKRGMIKPTGEAALFKKIWARSDKKCFVSGEPIPFYSVSCFCHVLPKKQFPDFRLHEKNIALVLIDVHHLYDNGTQEQRERSGYDFSPLYGLREELLLEYNEIDKE